MLFDKAEGTREVLLEPNQVHLGLLVVGLQMWGCSCVHVYVCEWGCECMCARVRVCVHGSAYVHVCVSVWVGRGEVHVAEYA